MFERIIAILVKEFLQTFRDPRMKMVIFIAPLIQILIFGYAATMDITNIPMAVYDLDNSPESREVIRRFSYSKYFNVKKNIDSLAEMKRVIDASEVLVVMKFDRGFGRYLNGNRTSQMQLIVDGTDSNASSIILSYANTIIGNMNQEIFNERVNVYLVPNTQVPSVALCDRRWFNPNLISRNYYLPGVIALIVTIMSLLLSAMAIVREKEIGTMEQLIVSPISPIELILGKILPFAVIALVQVTLITLLGTLWFKVPIVGSITLLLVSTLIYLLTSLGLGIFISTISSTQQEAMMSVFLIFFPMTLLSGFAYPIANMPPIIQWATLINPLRYYLVIIRGIFLKGSTFPILWDEMSALLVIGLTVIVVSSLRFQKRVG